MYSGIDNLNRDNIYAERTYGKLEKEPLPKSPLIELGGRQRNGLISSDKPFGVLAEGLLLRKVGATRFELATF